MEDSAAVSEEFRDTTEVMEEQGLLPNEQKGKRELSDEQFQGGTSENPKGVGYT